MQGYVFYIYLRLDLNEKKHPCIKADTEERTLHNLQNGATVTRRDREETNC